MEVERPVFSRGPSGWSAGARNNSRQGVASTAWGPGSSYADPLMMPRRHPEQRPHTASSVERRVREQFRKEQLEAERVQPPRNRQDVRRRRAEYDAAAKQEGLVQRNWALVADLGARRGVERAVANTAANGRYGMQRRAEEAGRSLVEQQAAHAVRQMRGAHRGGGNADGMLVADEVKRQERWCTHCRGLHDPAKVGDPKWRPYTGQMRLENLGVVSPEFAGRYETGMLPVSLKETTAMDATNLDPVAGGSTNEMTRRRGKGAKTISTSELRWKDSKEGSMSPMSMPEDTMRELLPIFVDGCREQHEPYRYLAIRATEQLLDAAARRGLMASMLPGICSSIRLVINTFEPRFVGIGCHILRRILRLILDEASSQATARRKKSVEAAQAVLERLKTLVPVLALFWRNRERVSVPPKGCLPRTGSFTARGRAPEWGSRKCRTCGKDVDTEKRLVVRGMVGEDGAPVTAKAAVRMTEDGRPGVAVWVIGELVEETLRDVERCLGKTGTKVIKSYMPTWENV